MSDFDLTYKQLGDNIAVIATGKALDNNNAHEMVELISSIQDKGIKYTVVDMSSLNFLSSAGVGSIIGTVENSREMGGDIVLCNVSDNILHILEILDLKDFLTIKGSMEEAVNLS